MALTRITADGVANVVTGQAALDLITAASGTGFARTAAGTALQVPRINAAGNGWEFATPSGAMSQTFRGLHLRTGEQGNANTTVTLLHADEIVCSDGVRRLPADNLAAVITTAGIGGLRASQSEAANTWYKVMYAYGGSGEGLYLEQAKDYYKDAAFETAFDGYSILRMSTSTQSDRLAQGFPAGTSGKIEFVDLLLSRASTPTGNVWATIEADVAGDASGTPLATSTYVNVANIPTTYTQVRFVFRTPYAVTSGTTYHVVLYGDYAKSDSVAIGWGGVGAGGYAGGVARKYNGSAWSNAGVGDFNFKVYVTRNDNAVTPPAGYNTGYAHIGWVRNNVSSNFYTFVQRNRHVQWVPGNPGTATIQASTLYTAPTMFDLNLPTGNYAAGVPPVPVTLFCHASPYTIAGAYYAGAWFNSVEDGPDPNSNPQMTIYFPLINTIVSAPPMTLGMGAGYMSVNTAGDQIWLYLRAWEW